MKTTFPHPTCSLLVFLFLLLNFLCLFCWFPLILLYFYKISDIMLIFVCKYLMSFTLLTVSTSICLSSSFLPVFVIIFLLLRSRSERDSVGQHLDTSTVFFSHNFRVCGLLRSLIFVQDKIWWSNFYLPHFVFFVHLSISKIILSVDVSLWFCFSMWECKSFVCLFLKPAS